MRNQYDGLPLLFPLANFRHDDSLALDIDVARRFIIDFDRFVAGHAYCHGKALSFSPRDIVCVFVEHSSQAFVSEASRSNRIDFSKDRISSSSIPLFGHPEIVPNAFMENVAVITDNSYFS